MVSMRTQGTVRELHNRDRGMYTWEGDFCWDQLAPGGLDRSNRSKKEAK